MKALKQFIDHLDSQSASRRQELTGIVSDIERQREADKKRVCRSGLLLAYAHFEGFVIDSGRSYVQHVELQGNQLARLCDGLKVNALFSRLRGLEKSNRVWTFLEVVKVLRGEGTAQIDIKVIDAQGNLDYETFCDVLACCGLSTREFQLKQMYIDVNLVAARNRIAHGSLEPVSSMDALEACKFVREVIDQVKTGFLNAAVHKTYLS